MNDAPPRLTTFGALIRFATDLEAEAAEHYANWMAEADQGERDRLSALAAAHRRRADQLKRMVQEQLNEMTLEPITGLQADDYSGSPRLSAMTGASDQIAFAVELESRLARLYDDMVDRAGRVLGSATRSLERLARQSRLTIQELQKS